MRLPRRHAACRAYPAYPACCSYRAGPPTERPAVTPYRNALTPPYWCVRNFDSRKAGEGNSETQDGGSKRWRKIEKMQRRYGVGCGEPQGRNQNRLCRHRRNNLRNRDRLVRLQRRPRVTAMILLMTAGVRRAVRRCLRETEATAKPA